MSATPPEAVVREQFSALAKDVGKVWQSPDVDVRLKKRLIRTLVEEVIVDMDPSAGWIEAVIHWRGGVHTGLRVRRRRRGQSLAYAHPGAPEAIEQLARICDDAMIANVLNRNGTLTARGNRWSRGRVCSYRSKHGIPKYNDARRIEEGWLNLTQAADHLAVSPRALRKAVQRGEIPALHPLADGPWLFRREHLETQAAQASVERIKHRRRGGGLRDAQTLSLYQSST